MDVTPSSLTPSLQNLPPHNPSPTLSPAGSAIHHAGHSLAIINTSITDTSKPTQVAQHVHIGTVTVHTNKPTVEEHHVRYDPPPKGPVYHGPVNLLSTIDTNKSLMCVKYTEDKHNIAAGFSDGVIRVFNDANGKCTRTLVDDECKQYPGPVTTIKHRCVNMLSPVSNTLLASYINGCVKCWAYKRNECLYTIREKRQTLGLAYHPRWFKFFTYGDDCRLNLYNEEVQLQERSFSGSDNPDKIDGHLSRIYAGTFHPRSYHELITGGWDDMVLCWDDRVPSATRYFKGVHICGEGLDFDDTGRYILTCSWQSKHPFQIWDYGSCKLIRNIEPDKVPSMLYCGKYVPDTRSNNLIVCSGSNDNMIRVVDIDLPRTQASIRNNVGAIYAFDFGLFRKKPVKSDFRAKTFGELQKIPRVAFVAGKKLITVDFG